MVWARTPALARKKKGAWLQDSRVLSTRASSLPFQHAMPWGPTECESLEVPCSNLLGPSLSLFSFWLLSMDRAQGRAPFIQPDSPLFTLDSDDRWRLQSGTGRVSPVRLVAGGGGTVVVASVDGQVVRWNSRVIHLQSVSSMPSTAAIADSTLSYATAVLHSD